MRRARALAWGLAAVGSTALVVALAARHHISYELEVRDAESCIGCHAEVNPQVVAGWRESAHFARGVTCEACHGTEHPAMIAARAQVSPKVCAQCHPGEVEAFSSSVHARALASLAGSELFPTVPEALQTRGCEVCHAIGAKHDDGGQGQCQYCHNGHRFSAAQARTPEACGACHRGPEHPQFEAWSASQHGMAYAATGDENAPTCQTCHLGGAHGHTLLGGLTYGQGLLGGVLAGETGLDDSKRPEGWRRITAKDAKAGRAEMVQVCRRCHSSNFAARALHDADAVKKQADGLVVEAGRVVRELYNEGLLSPMPQARPPHPTGGHTLVLGGAYRDTSVIEQRYFRLARLLHTMTFKGAYHFSPEHAHWRGYAEMEAEMTSIRDEAARLRRERTTLKVKGRPGDER